MNINIYFIIIMCYIHKNILNRLLNDISAYQAKDSAVTQHQQICLRSMDKNTRQEYFKSKRSMCFARRRKRFGKLLRMQHVFSYTTTCKCMHRITCALIGCSGLLHTCWFCLVIYVCWFDNLYMAEVCFLQCGSLQNVVTQFMKNCYWIYFEQECVL